MAYKTFNCNALQGGAERALDALSVADLTTLDRAIVSVSGVFYYFVYLSTGTAAENVTDHPYIIRPDDYVTAGNWVESTLGDTCVVRDGSRNLVVKNASSSTIDIDADELVLQTTAGLTHRARAVNITIDSAASGANGLDTGAIANADYGVYVSYNPTTHTTAGLISLNMTAPTLSGYTYHAFVSFAKRSAGSILPFRQTGKTYRYLTRHTALSGGTAVTPTSVSLATIVPVNIDSIFGVVSNVTTSGIIYIDNLDFTAGDTLAECVKTITGTWSDTFALHAMTTDQVLYYKAASGGPYTIYISGWTWR